MLKFPPMTTCILFIGIVLVPIALGLHYPLLMGLLLFMAISLISLFFVQPPWEILLIGDTLTMLLICWGGYLQIRRQDDPQYKRLK